MFHVFEYKEQNFLLEQLKAPGLQGFRREPPLHRELGSCQQANPMRKCPGLFATVLVDGNIWISKFQSKSKWKKNHKINLPPFLFCLCVFSHLVVIQVPFQQQYIATHLCATLHTMHPRCFAMQIGVRFQSQAQLTKRPWTKFPLELNFSV